MNRNLMVECISVARFVGRANIELLCRNVLYVLVADFFLTEKLKFGLSSKVVLYKV